MTLISVWHRRLGPREAWRACALRRKLSAQGWDGPGLWAAMRRKAAALLVALRPQVEGAAPSRTSPSSSGNRHGLRHSIFDRCMSDSHSRILTDSEIHRIVAMKSICMLK